MLSYFNLEEETCVHSPKFEVRVYHSVGETFTANTDTFKYTVACQLVHYQVRVNNSRLFQFVGNDTTYEVRLSGSQCGHQVVQLFLWSIKNIISRTIISKIVLDV